LRIIVKVKPGAHSNEVKKLSENSYEVRVTAQPEKGKANKSVIDLLSRYLKIPKSRFILLKGTGTSLKVFEVD
jgi:hypothetical protein